MKVGDKYGRLTISKWIVGKIKNHGRVEAICECGKWGIYLRSNLASGNTKSCGCLQKEKCLTNRLKHGLTETHEYQTWTNIKSRCYLPSVQSYKYYGAQGVKVCKRWLHSFENFYADMGPRPSGKHSIDRINPFGDYKPSNCRWATWKQQMNNRRMNHASE